MTVADGVRDAGSASVSGLFAYRTGAGGARQLVWFDRFGTALGSLGAAEVAASSPHIAPDGRRVAVHRTVQDNTDIWLYEGSRATRFTSDAARDLWPYWSRDGLRIVFDSNRSGRRDLYVRVASGASTEELLLSSPEPKIAQDWSPDGRFLFYSVTTSRNDQDVWVMPMEGDRRPWPFVATPFEDRGAQFSPDGKWAVYSSGESGRDEIYVRPFTNTPGSVAPGTLLTGRKQVSIDGGLFPRWRSDGMELYYLAPGDRLMAVSMSRTGETLEPGNPVELFRPRIAGGYSDPGFGRQYDVAPDGRFLINTALDVAASPIVILQNWQPR